MNRKEILLPLTLVTVLSTGDLSSQESNNSNLTQKETRDVHLTGLIEKVLDEGIVSTRHVSGEPLHYTLKGQGEKVYSLQDTNADGKFNGGDFFTIKPRDLPIDSSQLERCFYELTVIQHPENSGSFDISTQLCHDSLSPEFSDYSGKYLDVSNHSKEKKFERLDYYLNTYIEEK